MKQIMLVETNLATAGHDVFHVYTAKDEADSEFIADTLFNDSGDGWDIVNARNWDVNCIASSEYGNERPVDFAGEVFYESDFIHT